MTFNPFSFFDPLKIKILPKLIHAKAVPQIGIDIVYPDSERCCCFTKSYYRYVKGTGSLLATIMVSFHKHHILFLVFIKLVILVKGVFFSSLVIKSTG